MPITRIIGSVIAILLGSAVLAEEAQISFPANYKTDMINYLSLDRTQNDDQIIRLFASKSALEAARAGGELPYGTVIVAEVYKAKKDDSGNVVESALGRRVRDKFAAVAVMEKRKGFGANLPEELRNGNWDFAIFKPSGERLVKKDLNKCRSCHMPLVDTQHLFSLEHMAAN